ncbi:MAG: universal stress protein [Omnitrophica WOR_2 bacterium]
MSDGEDEERLIRRILIALDASPHSLTALRAAAELAARLNAELSGLFVEDINLLRMADLPFARQVSFYSATTSQMDRQQIEIQLRAQAAQARRALMSLSERARLRSTFRVVRGHIPTELLQAASEADLIILGRSGWSHRRQLGSTARVIIAQSPRHTLVLHQEARLQQASAVLYDGSEESRRALSIALSLMREHERLVFVLLLTKNVEEARSMQNEAVNLLRPHYKEARFRWLIKADPDVIKRIIQTEQLGALIIPAKTNLFSNEEMMELLNKIDIPVWIVR